MKLKKYVTAISICVAMLSCLVGCGGDDKKSSTNILDTNLITTEDPQLANAAVNGEFEFGYDDMEEAKQAFYNTVCNEDIETAKRLSFEYYICYRVLGKDEMMFDNYKWYNYFQINYIDESIVNGLRFLSSDGVDRDNVKVDKYHDIDRMVNTLNADNLRHAEEGIEERYGIVMPVYAGVSYGKFYNSEFALLKVDNRWFVTCDQYFWW